MFDSLSAHLARLAGADLRRAALCPPLTGRWSSAGLSVAVAAHVSAAAGAIAAGQLLMQAGGPLGWVVVVGLPVYGASLLGLGSGLPHLLRQFDRPGPDLLAARWVLTGLVGLLLIAGALLLAWPYEVTLTGQYVFMAWATPLALLRWALRGVGLATLAVPLIVRRALARSPSYGALCHAEYQLKRLAAARSVTSL